MECWRKLSLCEYAPNIVYTIAMNNTKSFCSYEKGGKIRFANNMASMSACYWDKDGNYRVVPKTFFENDWADKIYVIYDKEKVYKQLLENAIKEKEHYQNFVDDALRKITKYEIVLEELREN